MLLCLTSKFQQKFLTDQWTPPQYDPTSIPFLNVVVVRQVSTTSLFNPLKLFFDCDPFLDHLRELSISMSMRPLYPSNTRMLNYCLPILIFLSNFVSRTNGFISLDYFCLIGQNTGRPIQVLWFL